MLTMQNKNLFTFEVRSMYLECIILDPKKYCSLYWNLDSTYDYSDKFNITTIFSYKPQLKIQYITLYCPSSQPQ